MASTVDELSMDYHENGQQVVKQLDKAILSKGAWATVMFRYQELDRKTSDYGPPKYSIRRYQKRHGEYQQKSKFTISSQDQANKIIEVLGEWVKESVPKGHA